MREYRKILRNREARIVRRLRRKQWCNQVKPMMSGGNIHYEISGKAEAITCGGTGAFHHLVRRVGLVKEIDRHLHLLKVLVAPFAKRICLRGDTDFSLTRHFDRWSEKVDFVFGMDAYRGLVKPRPDRTNL